VNNHMEPTRDVRDRELDLLLAIDTVRDTIDDDVPPNVMFEQLLALLIKRLNADAAAIVVQGNGKNMEYLAAIGPDVQHNLQLCRQIIQQTSPPNLHRLRGEQDATGIGLRVRINNETLGALVLLRRAGEAPFDDDTLRVLGTAETMIDSAIVQVQRIWRLKQRDRELAAIYRLDQLRDSDSDEMGLINSFVQIIIEQFNAALCVVSLSHIDSGEMIVRGIVDRVGLKPPEFQAMNQAIYNLPQTQPITSPRDGLNLLAAPFLAAGMQLGAVIVGRESAFHDSDRRLLYALSTQMDSAVVHSRVIQQLSQRNKELQIIYNIDRIRDSDVPFDTMLQSVLGELCKAIDADIGFILLFDAQEEDQLEIKSSSQGGVMTSQAYYEAIQRISEDARATAEMVYENKIGGEVRSVLAVPLVLRDRIIGVFGGVNSNNPIGFTAEDRRMLNAIVTQVDTAVFEKLEQRRVRQVLGRSVDPKVLNHLLEHTDAATVLAGERMTISVLFADLRGSTEWAERMEPTKLAHALNQYLGKMADVIFEYGGTLDKFVGDEVIGLFGAPLSIEDHAICCAKAAYKMQQVMAQLRQRLQAEGYDIPQMGVGISTGDAICGEFGTAQRTDYTAIGRMMNLGSRLCSAAKGGEIMICQGTYEAIGSIAEVEMVEDVHLKGIGKATAYRLLKLETQQD
jgi:adenylate cyclase